jgi:DNA polymerase III alpha subunit
MGIKLELPCINRSNYEYTGKHFIMRLGLMAIKNISYGSIEKILSERKLNGKYMDLADFLVRTRTRLEETSLLIKCGAMDCFKKTRPTLLRLLDIFLFKRKILNEGFYDLFVNESFDMEKDLQTRKNFSLEEKCKIEYETFGFMVTKHPLHFYKEIISNPGIITAEAMALFKGKKVEMTGWFVSSKRIRTKKGDIMKFLSLEDLTGTFEAVIFPNVYYNCAEKTSSMGPYILKGKVDDNDQNNLIVDTLAVISSAEVKEADKKDSVDHNYYGDKEKIDEEEVMKTLGKKNLLYAYLKAG